MIIQLLFVSFVLLGNQLDAVLVSVPNSGGYCGTTDYRFDDVACRIVETDANYSSIFCDAPIAPKLMPSTEFPRMFKMGVPLSWKDEKTHYCAYEFWRTLALDDPCRAALPDLFSASEEELTQCWLRRSMDAVTHLKADFFIKSNTGNIWDPKGQFGPLFYRIGFTEKAVSGYLAPSSILGFDRYDTSLKIANFEFFLPSNMKTTDSTIQKWLLQVPMKTDFDVGVDLVSACKEGVTGKRCETKSTITPATLQSFIPKDPKLMDATVLEAKLFSNRLSLKLQWSDYDTKRYIKTAVESATVNCRPKLIAIVYDSNPDQPRNTGSDVKTYKNSIVRSVLAKFSKVLAWDTTKNKLEDAYNLYSSIDEWAIMERKIQFLKNINSDSVSPTVEDDARIFYQGWNKENGLSIAISVCMCDSSLSITDRNRGCREYKLQALGVDQTYWNGVGSY